MPSRDGRKASLFSVDMILAIIQKDKQKLLRGCLIGLLRSAGYMYEIVEKCFYRCSSFLLVK